MKNLYFTLVFISLISSAHAQKIRFTDKSNKWICRYADIGMTVVTYGYYYLDTIVKIDTLEYKYLTANSSGNFWNGIKDQKILVREDTITGKVYMRVYKGPGMLGNQVSNAERVLFDYNLNIGDTFNVIRTLDTLKYRLVTIDSILIGNVSHRVFHMRQILPQYIFEYAFIEGVGCVNNPILPFIPEDYSFESSFDLYCFINNGNKPTFSKQVHLINNTTSCHVGISNQDYVKRSLDIFPQPATSIVNIQLPARIQSGTLAVYNQLGQVVINTTVLNSELLEIHNTGNLHGLHYYRITDNTENTVYSGKMLFE